MISTFDLTLLGGLVSAGGMVFLRQGKSSAVAGARWLAVGALTLFVAYVHGADDGYLFSPWGDVMFHVFFVSTAWGMTAFRIKQSAERPHRKPTPDRISSSRFPCEG
ncbi:MAG TPA: hypothetical protein VJ746_03515 [Nitrospira sp.]|nr:hypothetical protein [Nitrospira sp.]